MGDKVLTDLSRLVQLDIGNDDALFRIGGEEFVVLLPRTSLAIAKIVGEKLRELVEAGITTIPGRKNTISMGISEIQPGDTASSIYRRADQSLYFAKTNGKNRVVIDAVQAKGSFS